MKKYKFFYHYNKPLSQQKGCMMMSVHFRNQCHFARAIDVRVPSKSKERAKQPRCVMEGYATAVTVEGDTIIIS